MMQLRGILVYPIKALGGIRLEKARIEPRGIALDRRWMLVDAHNHFITQRQFPILALFRLRIVDRGIMVRYQSETCFIPLDENAYPERATVQVWEDTLDALIAAQAINDWFSKQLGQPCRLAFQGLSSVRMTSAKYAPSQEVSLADGYPYLMISEESVTFLNKKLDRPISIDRFRPNFIISGSYPHVEDDFHFFKIGKVRFQAVKSCVRCTVITIDQSTAEGGKEPLTSLADYRKKNNKIYFGQHLIYQGTNPATVYLGDRVEAMKERDLTDVNVITHLRDEVA